MASLSTPPAFTGARSALRHNEPNVSLKSGIAPLQRRAFVGSRRAARPVGGPARRWLAGLRARTIATADAT